MSLGRKTGLKFKGILFKENAHKFVNNLPNFKSTRKVEEENLNDLFTEENSIKIKIMNSSSRFGHPRLLFIPNPPTLRCEMGSCVLAVIVVIMVCGFTC